MVLTIRLIFNTQPKKFFLLFDALTVRKCAFDFYASCCVQEQCALYASSQICKEAPLICGKELTSGGMHILSAQLALIVPPYLFLVFGIVKILWSVKSADAVVNTNFIFSPLPLLHLIINKKQELVHTWHY